MAGAVALVLGGFSPGPGADAIEIGGETQPNGGETLEADFVLPQADRVPSLEAVASGKALEKEKIKFTPADKVPNYHCAVLLAVDKTLGWASTQSRRRKWSRRCDAP